ncbi:MAG TPA: phosphotransferase family protein [Jatrophihabitans sp.]|nr:phosphotransferase family protein [Jatrophihabitans sp.]
MTTVDRPADDTLWRCVLDTLGDVILPALRPGFERDSARQLTGVARYALSRPPDRGVDRARELGRLLALPDSTGLQAALAAASRALAAGDVPQLRSVLLRYLDEDIAAAAPLLETFSGHDPSADEPDVVAAPEAAELGKWLSRAFGREIDDLDVAVMVGGHSRRMLSAAVSVGGARHELVVRIEQGGMFGTEGEPEARVMRALAEGGFPAPPVRWIESDPSVLGQPFFVMDRVPGSPAVDDAKLAEYVRKLHELHTLDPAVAADGLGPVPQPEAAVTNGIDHWLSVYRRSALAPIPLLEAAAEWLRANLRPTGPTCIVHGDPGPGNFLHDGTTITAFTDWEFAHYGDAAEDWTYFGVIRARKLQDAQGWRTTFAEHAGVRYDDVTWGSWTAFNLFKGACANLSALRLFRDGVSTAPNMLAIGTAVHLRFLKQLVDRIDDLSSR